MLEQQITEWMRKVLESEKTPGATNTYQMMLDIHCRQLKAAPIFLKRKTVFCEGIFA